VTDAATSEPEREGAAAATNSGGVTVRSIVKRFGDFVAVKGVDIDIAQGEFFTLLGPSGCGKTTTLRMIAGFEEPDEGQILIDDKDVAGLPAHKRPTNTVFQSYALFPHLSVKDNVAYGLKRKGVSKSDVDGRVQAELERVGLWGEANRKPNQLSGGQQQRVALARAIVNRPQVLLLDEPLGALDLKLRKALQIELKKIQQDVGITFVYVTHDQEEALTMSDRIAVMNQGIIEQIATPEEVYERPSTTFVAGFIGVSNLMPGTVRSISGENAEVELEAGITVNAPANGLATGESCHAVVRPEKLVVSSSNGSGPADGMQSVEGVVASSVYLGTATQLVVELKGDARMTVLVPNADEQARQDLPGGGANVKLAWAPEHIHLVLESGSERATFDHEALTHRRSEEAATDG